MKKLLFVLPLLACAACSQPKGVGFDHYDAKAMVETEDALYDALRRQRGLPPAQPKQY